jgi:hypothetical protein
MAAKQLPDVETLRKLLDYDPETGVLTWKHRSADMFTAAGNMSEHHICQLWNGKHAGKPALSKTNHDGYSRGRLLGKFHMAHRVAWAIHFGRWPKTQLDHIDGNPANNRIVNLREASQQENNKNKKKRKDNTSGIVGVCWYKDSRKWAAHISVCGRLIYLGLFDQIDDAARARKEAETLHGYHSNHGRD